MSITQIDKAIQKREELEFYNQQLKRLINKQKELQAEVNLTRDVIKLVKQDPIGEEDE